MNYNSEAMAYCGIYCLQCPFKIVGETKGEDRKHLFRMPEKYDKIKEKEFYEQSCGGCKVDDFCGDCDMKSCAESKGIEHCAQCDTFPCEFSLKFEEDGVPHHKEAISNLRTIQKIGIEPWFAELEKKLFCSCGERQSWYYQCDCHEKNAENLPV